MPRDRDLSGRIQDLENDIHELIKLQRRQLTDIKKIMPPKLNLAPKLSLTPKSKKKINEKKKRISKLKDQYFSRCQSAPAPEPIRLRSCLKPSFEHDVLTGSRSNPMSIVRDPEKISYINAYKSDSYDEAYKKKSKNNLHDRNRGEDFRELARSIVLKDYKCDPYDEAYKEQKKLHKHKEVEDFRETEKSMFSKSCISDPYDDALKRQKNLHDKNQGVEDFRESDRSFFLKGFKCDPYDEAYTKQKNPNDQKKEIEAFKALSQSLCSNACESTMKIQKTCEQAISGLKALQQQLAEEKTKHADSGNLIERLKAELATTKARLESMAKDRDMLRDALRLLRSKYKGAQLQIRVLTKRLDGEKRKTLTNLFDRKKVATKDSEKKIVTKSVPLGQPLYIPF